MNELIRRVSMFCMIIVISVNLFNIIMRTLGIYQYPTTVFSILLRDLSIIVLALTYFLHRYWEGKAK